MRVRFDDPAAVRLRTPFSKEPNQTTNFIQQKRIFWARSSSWSASEHIFLMYIQTPLGMGNFVLMGLSLLHLFACPLCYLPFLLFPLHSTLSTCPGSLVVSQGKP